MEISLTKLAPQSYRLRLGDTEIDVAEGELKVLLLQITKLLTPAAGFEKSAEELTREFMDAIGGADDVAIQKFLLLADNGDILVLLKAAENNHALLEKLYTNMSERSRKIFAEDLAYKYKDGVPSSEVGAAIGRLVRVVRDSQEENPA